MAGTNGLSGRQFRLCHSVREIKLKLLHTLGEETINIVSKFSISLINGKTKNIWVQRPPPQVDSTGNWYKYQSTSYRTPVFLFNLKKWPQKVIHLHFLFQEDWTSKQIIQINTHVSSCMAWKANLIKSIAIESSVDIFCQFLGSLNYEKALRAFCSR